MEIIPVLERIAAGIERIANLLEPPPLAAGIERIANLLEPPPPCPGCEHCDQEQQEQRERQEHNARLQAFAGSAASVIWSEMVRALPPELRPPSGIPIPEFLPGLPPVRRDEDREDREDRENKGGKGKPPVS